MSTHAVVARSADGGPFIDVLVENHGSIILLRPVSPQADEWLRTRLEPNAQFFGGAAVVEPRYVRPILDGMKSDGLEVRA